jgi:hypothetical protein
MVLLSILVDPFPMKDFGTIVDFFTLESWGISEEVFMLYTKALFDGTDIKIDSSFTPWVVEVPYTDKAHPWPARMAGKREIRHDGMLFTFYPKYELIGMNLKAIITIWPFLDYIFCDCSTLILFLICTDAIYLLTTQTTIYNTPTTVQCASVNAAYKKASTLSNV